MSRRRRHERRRNAHSNFPPSALGKDGSGVHVLHVLREVCGPRWGEGGSRSLALGSFARATILVNATHDVNDSKIRFDRDGKQVEVLEVRPSECLRLKEDRRSKD